MLQRVLRRWLLRDDDRLDDELTSLLLLLMLHVVVCFWRLASPTLSLLLATLTALVDVLAAPE